MSLMTRLQLLEATHSPAQHEPRVSLEKITDDDLQTLLALTPEQYARLQAHPRIVATFFGSEITVEQGALMGEIAREIIACT